MFRCFALARRIRARGDRTASASCPEPRPMIVSDGLFVVVVLHRFESPCVTNFQHKYKCAKWLPQHTHRSLFEGCRFPLSVRDRKHINSECFGPGKPPVILAARKAPCLTNKNMTDRLTTQLMSTLVQNSSLTCLPLCPMAFSLYARRSNCSQSDCLPAFCLRQDLGRALQARGGETMIL